MKTKLSLTTHELGSVSLSNRIVMAPMTRSRAINNIPNQLMATYYAQRAGAGLIITEGVSPSLNGLGYSRIPGVFSAEQTADGNKSHKPCTIKAEKFSYNSCTPEELDTMIIYRMGDGFSAIRYSSQRKDVDRPAGTSRLSCTPGVNS